MNIYEVLKTTYDNILDYTSHLSSSITVGNYVVKMTYVDLNELVTLRVSYEEDKSFGLTVSPSSFDLLYSNTTVGSMASAIKYIVENVQDMLKEKLESDLKLKQKSLDLFRALQGNEQLNQE